MSASRPRGVAALLQCVLRVFDCWMLFHTLQEWNEIQYNGVYYEPPKNGAPGELPTYDTSYTFRYPRPPK